MIRSERNECFLDYDCFMNCAQCRSSEVVLDRNFQFVQIIEICLHRSHAVQICFSTTRYIFLVCIQSHTEENLKFCIQCWLRTAVVLIDLRSVWIFEIKSFRSTKRPMCCPTAEKLPRLFAKQRREYFKILQTGQIRCISTAQKLPLWKIENLFTLFCKKSSISCLF